MRILFFDEDVPYLLKDDNKPFGGAAVDIYNQLLGLQANGLEASLLTWKGAIDLIGDKIEEVPFAIVESYVPDNNVLFFHTLFHKVPAIFKAVKDHKPHYITAKGASVLNGFLLLVTKFNRSKFVYQMANDVEADGRIYNKLSWHGKAVFRFIISQADLVRCQNEYQLENYLLQYPRKKAFKVKNALVVTENVKINPYGKRKHVLWVGTFRPQKNLKNFYKICKKLDNVSFKIAGDFVDEGDLETKQAHKGLKKLKNVELMGFVKRKQIKELMSEAYCLVCTSEHEGFPNIFLEAWLEGTPVITTPTSNPDNVIGEESLGFVAVDEGSFIKYITLLMSDEEEFNKISKKCLDYVITNHEHKKIAEELAKFLHENTRS